jgi:hypothetical protein
VELTDHPPFRELREYDKYNEVQNMSCPKKPKFLDFVSVLTSFLTSTKQKDNKQRYDEGIEQLKQLVSNWAKRTETIRKRIDKEPEAEEWIKKLKGAVNKDGKLNNDKSIGI